MEAVGVAGIVPVCADQVTDGVVGPLPDLRDVLAGEERELTRVDHEHLTTAHDDCKSLTS
jgi:hypothetical protein